MGRGSGYVQVVGNLSANAGGFSINVHRIFPVSSFNSILHHTMKVIQTFLTFRRQFVGTASQSVTSLDATLENVVIQALQMLQQETPQGVRLESLLAVLREYGITEDQVRYCRGVILTVDPLFFEWQMRRRCQWSMRTPSFPISLFNFHFLHSLFVCERRI